MAQDCTGIQDIEDTSKMVEDTSRKGEKMPEDAKNA